MFYSSVQSATAQHNSLHGYTFHNLSSSIYIQKKLLELELVTQWHHDGLLYTHFTDTSPYYTQRKHPMVYGVPFHDTRVYVPKVC
jgi:hypothetical protein